MSNRTIFIIVAGLIVIAALVYFTSIGSANKVKLVQSDEFANLLNEEVFVLQVHTPYYGEIEGTNLVVEDWENIEKYLDDLPNKDKKIAVYCRSGRMSGEVSKRLVDLGYENIYDLEGGMNSWQNTGRELVIKER